MVADRSRRDPANVSTSPAETKQATNTPTIGGLLPSSFNLSCHPFTPSSRTMLPIIHISRAYIANVGET